MVVKNARTIQTTFLPLKQFTILMDGKLKSLRLIGDAESPNIIAQAVFSGHLAAREFDEVVDPDKTPFKLER